jgi:hypothetical protein
MSTAGRTHRRGRGARGECLKPRMVGRVGDSVSFTRKDFNIAFGRIVALPHSAPRAERVARAQDTMWNSLEVGQGLPELLRHAMSQWDGLPFTLQP